MEEYQVRQRQALPLDLKIKMSQRRIRDWYSHWEGLVYVSFSGGKDSTVLLDLVRGEHPDVPAVFCDTGLEYPEIRNFVKTVDNVVWLKPKMTFVQVIEQYGFPVISKEQSCAISRYRNTADPQQKHYRLNGYPNGRKGMIAKRWQFALEAPFKISDTCCDVMKKRPMDKYAKESGRRPIMGMIAAESRGRKMQYMKNGCNAFELKKPVSWPLAFWTDKDIWAYIEERELPISEIYRMGESRTGCMFCAFGAHLEESPNRFERMKKTHPTQYRYCIEKLGLGEVLDFFGIPY